MPMLTRFCTSVILLTLALAAQAFEPGTAHVCTPSADGQTFECHDNAAAAAPESKPKAAEPSPATHTMAPADTPAEPAASAAPTRKLPNYLMQNPSVEPSSSPSASTPVETVAPIEPVNDTEATPAPSTESEASVASSVESTPPQTPAPATVATPSASASEQVVAEAQPQTITATAPAAIAEKPKLEQESAVVEQTAEPPVETHANPPGVGVSGTSEFLSLPASHYTLVLASVRNAAALDALILSLQNLPGRLYLLKLGMPDGDWYSLCWSDFADLDAARAARASLPVDAAITSGWPRRIGLLQNELAR